MTQEPYNTPLHRCIDLGLVVLTLVIFALLATSRNKISGEAKVAQQTSVVASSPRR